jgi:PRC-barrel domain
MLWRASDLEGYGLAAADGAIGTVKDLLFDDRDWTVRWAVVDTGSWLPGRKVLLPPTAFGEADPVGRRIPVDLTRDRVKDSPGVEVDQPVSR